MDQKLSLKITGVVVFVVLVFGGAYLLGSRNTAPKNGPAVSATPATGMKQGSASSPEQASTGKAAAQNAADASATTSANASIDDIAKNIVSDTGDDQNALDNEASSETSDIDAGSKTLNDLGQSYDETKY